MSVKAAAPAVVSVAFPEDDGKSLTQFVIRYLAGEGLIVNVTMTDGEVCQGYIRLLIVQDGTSLLAKVSIPAPKEEGRAPTVINVSIDLEGRMAVLDS